MSKAYQTLARYQQANKHQPTLGFHLGLAEAVRELKSLLIAIYAELDGGGDAPLRDELVTVIGDRISAFIQSSVAGVRGNGAAPAAREGANLIALLRIGVGRDFDLAVHERMKRQSTPAATTAAVPTRRKQDKFEILDSPRQYDIDFEPSVGLLGVSVVYFDLDDFKQLNTRFTEPVIDRTLLPDLQRLIAALVADHGYAYAEGGDEFIVMLRNANTALAEAFTCVLLERIRSTIFMIDGDAVRVTASAGVASSTMAEDAQACREAASSAKRDAKKQGKDRLVVSMLRT